MPLAVTQEFYHVGVAPNELEDVATALVAAASRQLGVSAPALEREFRARKRVRSTSTARSRATQVEPLRGVKGVHLEGVFRRFYPVARSGAAGHRRLAPGRPVGGSGLERALDSLLTGAPGEAVLLKDRAGRRYDSPAGRSASPVPGNDVVLTIDAELQEIAERGLDDAIAEMRGARAGDVVFLDPRTGELLALASRQAAAAEPDRVGVHRSVRAGLDGQALHRGGAADARTGGLDATR